MLRNKDRPLSRKARVQANIIANRGYITTTAAEYLQTAGIDFAHWLEDLEDEQLIEKLPNLTERLDYVYLLAVDVQKAAADVIGQIHAIRETLE